MAEDKSLGVELGILTKDEAAMIDSAAAVKNENDPEKQAQQRVVIDSMVQNMDRDLPTDSRAKKFTRPQFSGSANLQSRIENKISDN